MIPKHSPALTPGDFTPYFGAMLNRRKQAALDIHEVWDDLLPGRILLPTPTGRHALWTFLEGVDLQPGDEVLIAAYNFYIIVRLVIQQRLKPVFVDINPDTLCMDPDDLAQKITPRSRLVILTHMFGNPADMPRIQQICQKNHLLLFEDCAHAVGTLCDGHQVGQFGDGALFSFGIQKAVNSFGGGMLVLSMPLAENVHPPDHEVPWLTGTMDTFGRFLTSLLMAPATYGWTLHLILRLAQRLNLSRLQATIDPARDNSAYRFEVNERSPFKPFMLEMHRRQLKRVTENNTTRERIVSTIKDGITGCDAVTFLDENKHGRSNFSYFGLYVEDPEAMSAYLERQGVGSSPHEYYNCAALEQFAAYRSDCPQADYASRHLLRLPSFPTLKKSDIDRITAALRSGLSAVNLT